MKREDKPVSSASNQFKGQIKRITSGAVNSEVIIDIGEALITAIVTCQSVKDLGLKVGGEALALINAARVIVAKDLKANTSARNKLSGQVISCRSGAVNTEIIIKPPGGQHLTAIITNESAKILEIKTGDLACGLFKASQVIIAVN